MVLSFHQLPNGPEATTNRNHCSANTIQCWIFLLIFYLLSFSFILQIFPDPVEVFLSTEGCLTCTSQGKERLPSIVVEPTDVSEVESGELRWPPKDMDFDEDEDLFLEQCIPPANIADWGEDEEESSVIENHQQNTSLLGTFKAIQSNN